MNALILTIFCSFALVSAMLALFVIAVRRGDTEHGERLSLLPLDETDSHNEANQ